MRIRARIGRNVVAWLAENPSRVGDFASALERVCQDELTLIRHSWAIVDGASAHMQRYFRVDRQFIAVMEWHQSERHIRVHTVRLGTDPTTESPKAA